MLRVATWNVLAPAYALPTRYSGVAADDLAAETRSPRVHALLARLLERCDVVAVQEADPGLVAHLESLEGVAVVAVLRDNGRDGVLLASTRQRLDEAASGRTADGRRCWAAATLVDDDPSDGSSDGSSDDAAGGSSDRGRVGGDRRRVHVVTVHLDPHWPQRRLHGDRQAEELVAWIEERCGPDPVVLVGDINATWDRRTGQVLRHAGFRPADPAPGSTAATHGRTRVLDLVATRGCTAQADPTGLPDPGTDLWLPSAAVPSDHAPVLADVSTEGSLSPI